jgi:hypothetical protein
VEVAGGNLRKIAEKLKPEPVLGPSAGRSRFRQLTIDLKRGAMGEQPMYPARQHLYPQRQAVRGWQEPPWITHLQYRPGWEPLYVGRHRAVARGRVTELGDDAPLRQKGQVGPTTWLGGESLTISSFYHRIGPALADRAYLRSRHLARDLYSDPGNGVEVSTDAAPGWRAGYHIFLRQGRRGSAPRPVERNTARRPPRAAAASRGDR